MVTNIWSNTKDIYGVSRGANTQVYTPQLTLQTPWVDTLVVTLGSGTWHWLISHWVY